MRSAGDYQTTPPCNPVNAGTPVMWKACRKCHFPLPRSSTQGVLAPGGICPWWTPVTWRSLYVCVVVTYRANREQRVGTQAAKRPARCRPPRSHTVKDYGRCSSALSCSCYCLRRTSMCCSPDELELRWAENIWDLLNWNHSKEIRKCQQLKEDSLQEQVI